MTELITRLYGRITGPSERAEAVPELMEALERLEKKPLTLAQMQTLCIRCLIELNGLLQGLKLQDVDLHGQLNRTLEKIPFKQRYQQRFRLCGRLR